MALTATQIYSVRGCLKLSLPSLVQENIAKLRIKPMVFKPFQKPPSRAPYSARRNAQNDNWREKALADIVRRVKEREDPEYSDIFSILNKVAPSNLDKLSNDAIEKIKRRDETFRLRIATLLFDKAITQHAYAPVMADMTKKIVSQIPEMKEDIQAQVSMFPQLYNLNETLTFPSSVETGFENKVVEWMKQKEKRKGYAKFMMELCVRDLVSDECVKSGLQNVIEEIAHLIRQPKTEQIDENVGQFAVFLYETAKLAKSPPLKFFMSQSLKSILNHPREWVPSLSARCRFKLEDALKLTK
jgi:hypothetical protein